MKRKKIITAIVLAMVMVFSGFCSNSVMADDDWCPLSPNEHHLYADHQHIGVGYSEEYGYHMHYIESQGEYVPCHRTKYYEYCRYKCVYCHGVDPSPLSLHTHSYIRHDATNTNEPID